MLFLTSAPSFTGTIFRGRQVSGILLPNHFPNGIPCISLHCLHFLLAI